jgi:signal transduction histidine kinase
MSQDNLARAKALLAQLEAQIPAEGKTTLQELKSALQAAEQKGEGKDAEELRQQLAAQIDETAQFISVMVHEIRKPMTSLRGYSDMLHKQVMGPLNDMQTQFVGTIRNNVISMEALVTDISDLSKMRSGRIVPSPKMEMLKNIMMGLEKEMPEQAEARKIKLTFDSPSGLPLLNIDSARVQQALRKLIENAIKYSPEETGEIIVTAQGEGDKLRVTVKDNGVGMTPAELARLGELFFRGDNEVVTQTKGYGMGIPIAMKCMELVGGELFWESEPGKGSTFGIVLPAMS